MYSVYSKNYIFDLAVPVLSGVTVVLMQQVAIRTSTDEGTTDMALASIVLYIWRILGQPGYRLHHIIPLNAE